MEYRRTTLVAFAAAAAMSVSAAPEGTPQTAFTSPLSTGVRLDPIGEAIELGSMPLGMAVAPEGDRVAVVLSGWREQGLQIVDLKSRRVLQTLTQPAAFFGVAFSRTGKEIYASGGNDDSVFCYSWRDGNATLNRKIALAQQPGKESSRYPAGLAVSRQGNYLYVAENLGDSLAV